MYKFKEYFSTHFEVEKDCPFSVVLFFYSARSLAFIVSLQFHLTGVTFIGV